MIVIGYIMIELLFIYLYFLISRIENWSFISLVF